MGCHFLLQGIFLTQGLNPGLLHCRWILDLLSYLPDKLRPFCWCQKTYFFVEKPVVVFFSPQRFEYFICLFFKTFFHCGHFCFFNLFFNWRKIVLQCCVDFCLTTRISHNYTYIVSLLKPPSSPPPHLSKSSQSARLGSLCYKATSVLHFIVVQSPSCVQLFATPWTVARPASLSLTISRNLPEFMSVELVILCICWRCFLHSSLLSFSHCVHKPILWFCISVPFLQRGSSILFF